MNAEAKTANGLIAQIISKLKPVKTNMIWGVYEISPEAAHFILDNYNHPRQRPLKHNKIALMSDDIANDYWEISHQGIGFSEEGWLIDGQNRMHAIIKAGKPARISICFNVPSKAMLILDNGVVRSMADGGNMAGMDIDSTAASIAKRMFLRARTHVHLSNQKALAFFEEHEKAIRFALEAMGGKKKGFTTAPIYAVVARAWYTADVSRLADFCRILKSGVVDDPVADKAAISFRDLLFRQKGGYGGAASAICYRKAQSSLVSFLRKEPLSKVYECSNEMFPIPGDEDLTVGDDEEPTGDEVI